MAQQEASREDKTLPASERKLQNARRDGQVARSRDLGHAMLLICTLGLLITFLNGVAQLGQTLVQTGLRFDAASAFSAMEPATRLADLSGIGLQIFYPVAIAGILASTVSAVIPGGMALSTKPLAPKLERISPLKGLKRLTSKNHLIDSIKLATMVGILTCIGAWYVSSNFASLANLIRIPIAGALSQGGDIITVGAAALLSLLLLVASIDVPMQWFRHRGDLKMTFQEARQENKETDGDPHLRARIRSRQREISTVRMLAEVPSADVIISNPTHYSVALKYDESSDGAPRVVAKGVDHIALKIREVARAADVVLIEAPPLARALYTHVKLDHEVPAALYGAVAQVLAYIFQLRQASRGLSVGELIEPTGLEVPAELDPENDASIANNTGERIVGAET